MTDITEISDLCFRNLKLGKELKAKGYTSTESSRTKKVLEKQK